jgi:hypothetical protein
MPFSLAQEHSGLRLLFYRVGCGRCFTGLGRAGVCHILCIRHGGIQEDWVPKIAAVGNGKFARGLMRECFGQQKQRIESLSEEPKQRGISTSAELHSRDDRALSHWTDGESSPLSHPMC